MAIVIPFAPPRRSQASSCSLPPRTAEILFFTGVRYERAPEVRPPAKPSTSARPRKVAARKSARRQPA